MKKIDNFLDRRRELVACYDKAFQSIDFISLTQLSWREQSSNHLYVVNIDFGKIGISRHHLMKKLADKGIGTQVHYIPVPMQPYYEQLGFSCEDYPITKNYYESALSIPLYFELSNDEQQDVINALITLVK